jgi:RND superfamily putative drug exporter
MSSVTNLDALQNYVNTLAAMPNVDHVVSIWSLVPPRTSNAFIASNIRLNSALATVARPYITETAAVIEVHLAVDPASSAATDLVTAIRTNAVSDTDGRFEVTVGGDTAINIDLLHHLRSRAALAMVVVLGSMILALMALFRSIVLPIKAVILNLLPIAASLGALVWVFQHGHLTGLFQFEPLGYLAVIVPIVVFCLMFGLSMDYEVIMLSRIREEWQRTGNNRLAIERGLKGSAGVVTSAALVMLVVFGAFGASRLQVIQQIGLSLAFAILIDATLVRLVALPAAMQLMGRWNWWFPGVKSQPAQPESSREVIA